MKITWISPEGKGWALAYKLRTAGNKVVYYNPSKNKNGSGYLPEATEATYLGYAQKSDLVVVDSVPESRRTRRSWSPSDLTMDVQGVRRSGVPVLGPTPTSELVCNDPRYFRKILHRHGLQSESVDQVENIKVTVSRDPEGQCFLVFRHRTLLGDNNGPELGNLGDVVLPVAVSEPLVARSVDKLNGFLDPARHRGYLNLSLSVTEPEVQVTGVDTGFLYPAIFIQFADLLLASHNRSIHPGIAVTVLNLKADQGDITAVEDILQYGGVFGGQIHRESEEGRAVLHGLFSGAVVGIGHDGQTVESDVDRKLTKLCSLDSGLGFRPGVGKNVGSHIKVLQSWGYLR
jgi:hypothetical protein